MYGTMNIKFTINSVQLKSARNCQDLVDGDNDKTRKYQAAV
jgi:hypothetical protein